MTSPTCAFRKTIRGEAMRYDATRSGTTAQARRHGMGIAPQRHGHTGTAPRHDDTGTLAHWHTGTSPQPAPRQREGNSTYLYEDRNLNRNTLPEGSCPNRGKNNNKNKNKTQLK
jgi:hypothetical protein